MNAILLAAAVTLTPVGEWVGYSTCFRADQFAAAMKAENVVSAGKFTSSGGERFELWTDGKGRFVVTMTAPPMRNAVCVIADGDGGNQA